MKSLKKGSIVKLFLVLLFIAFVIAGIFRDELPDIISNATIICFSCIGLK